MPQKKKEPNGCGCANIPLSLIIAIFGGGYWLFTQKGNLDISRFLPNQQIINIPILHSTPTTNASPTPFLSSNANNVDNNHKQAVNKTITPQATSLPPTPWEKKVIRGIYLSRYQITNNSRFAHFLGS